jgi:hypothetical protein
VFFTFKLKLEGCVGGGVTSAYGHGGSLGNLDCESGQLFGDSSAKAMLFWDTGDDSGINFTFRFTESKFGGRVTGERFKGERVRARFTQRPVNGDCAESPLIKVHLAGTIGL